MARGTSFSRKNQTYFVLGGIVIATILLFAFFTQRTASTQSKNFNYQREIKINHYHVTVSEAFKKDDQVLINLNRKLGSFNVSDEDIKPFKVQVILKDENTEAAFESYPDAKAIDLMHLIVSGITDDTKLIELYFYEGIVEEKKADVILDLRYIEKIDQFAKFISTDERMQELIDFRSDLDKYIKDEEQAKKDLQADERSLQEYEAEKESRMANLNSLWVNLDDFNNHIELYTAQAEVLDNELKAYDLSTFDGTLESISYENRDEIYNKLNQRYTLDLTLQDLVNQRNEIADVLEKAQESVKKIDTETKLIEEDIVEIKKFLEKGSEYFKTSSSIHGSKSAAETQIQDFAKMWGLDVNQYTPSDLANNDPASTDIQTDDKGVS